MSCIFLKKSNDGILYHSLFIHLVIWSSFNNSPENFAQNAGRLDAGQEIAPGSLYSLEPVWGQGAENHSSKLKGEWVPWRNLASRRSLTALWIRDCQVTWGCSHLICQPASLSLQTMSSRLCASAPPKSGCDRLWVTMVNSPNFICSYYSRVNITWLQLGLSEFKFYSFPQE